MRLGCHWIAEVSPSSAASLTDRKRVLEFLQALPSQLGLHPVDAPTVQQGPDGAVRGVVLLAESHASAHTDPKRGLVFVDLFSCTPFCEREARQILLQVWPGEVVVDRLLERP
jgi:S-adenosylmethionine/arginine decarboxylase-like enzyme